MFRKSKGEPRTKRRMSAGRAGDISNSLQHPPLAFEITASCEREMENHSFELVLVFYLWSDHCLSLTFYLSRKRKVLTLPKLTVFNMLLSGGSVVRVGCPITGMLVVRFPLAPIKKIGGGVSVHLLAMALPWLRCP